MGNRERIGMGARAGVVDLLGHAKERRQAQTRKGSTTDLAVGEDGLLRPRWALRSPELMKYYDTQWGVPLTDDEEMFRLLCLLIFQAGMLWGIAFEKGDVFDEAFGGFNPHKLAQFTEDDEARLLEDARLIRNRRKIRAVLANAKVVASLSGNISLAALVWHHRPAQTPHPQASAEIPRESVESQKLAHALRELGFTFVGPRICYSLMQSAGVVDTNLVGAHRRGCSGLWNEDGTVAHRLPVERSRQNGPVP